MRAIADIDDFTLLRRFVETDSQEAFSQLVANHIDLVYSVCLRETNDPVLAQDVTQAVFLTLFHKAPTIRKGTVLAGWLFNTSRFAARNAMRQEVRRKAVEEELVEAMSQSTGHIKTWQAVEPLLHEAIASLGTKEREAILLRYFEDESMKEVGLKLNITEHAAQMRVSRAIEKMKQHLRKNGVAVPVALLSTLLSEHAAQAAPASCTEAVGHLVAELAAGTTTAMSAGVTATKAHTISQGVMKSMFVNKLKVASMVAALSATGVAGVVSSRPFGTLSPPASAQAQKQNAAVSNEVRFVAAGIASAREKMKSAQVKVKYYHLTPKEFFGLAATPPAAPIKPPDKDQEKSYSASWNLKNARLFMIIQAEPGQADLVRIRRLWLDDKIARTLEEYHDPTRKKGATYRTGMIAPTGDVLNSNNIWNGQVEFDPRWHMFFSPSTAKPLDRLFLESNPPATFEGEEIFEGSRCAKIKVLSVKGSPTIHWVDVEHGFILRRMQQYQLLGDGSERRVLRREMQAPKLLESDGVWVPALVEKREYERFPESGVRDRNAIFPAGVTLESFKIEDGVATLPPSLKRITISDFKTNFEMPAEASMWDWPTGTQVTDKINRKHFEIGEKF